MAIDLERKFSDKEEKIRTYILDRINTYFSSSCFQRLQKRVKRLMDSWNMAPAGKPGDKSNQFKSKLVFPLVKEQMLLRRATTKANFRADPIASLEPLGDAPMENAVNAQNMLNLNYKHTEFRRRTFSKVSFSCSVLGSSVVVSDFRENITRVFKTVMGNFGAERKRIIVNNSQNVYNTAISILNYFQDPTEPEPSKSQYQGNVERWALSDLVSKIDDERYIKRNIKKAISEARESAMTNENYTAANKADENKTSIDVSRGFFRINIKGNEDDQTYYYMEMIGDHIIRFHANLFDEDIRNYSIYSLDERIDFWWGNTDAEYRAPHENYTNLFLNIVADNALRSTQRLTFYKKGTVDFADIANRHKNGGYIGVDLEQNEDLRKLLHHEQPVDQSNNNAEFIMKYVNDSLQRMTTKPDLSRTPVQGGPGNKTASAANLLDEQGNILESDLLETFSYGIMDTSKNNVILLQQFLPDQFGVRPNIREAPNVLDKSQILGSFNYQIKSSLQKNKLAEATRLNNIMTNIINYVSTGRPEFQKVNLTKVFRDWIRKLDIGEVDDILPEEAQFLAEQGGPPGIPATQPQIPTAQPAIQGVPDLAQAAVA